MIVNVNEFLNTYTSKEWGNGRFIDSNLYIRLKESTEPFVEIPGDSITQMTNRRNALILRDAEFRIISLLRSEGVRAESEDDPDAAMDFYRQSIEIGESSEYDLFHAYLPSYECAIRLARKMRMRGMEIILLESLLGYSISGPIARQYTERLNQLIA